jgi:predicted RNA-binding Zn-ribbon protein involved in translation (DUF1610 family)
VAQFACDSCGYEGRSREPVDTVLCPRCGEPVTLVADDGAAGSE